MWSNSLDWGLFHRNMIRIDTIGLRSNPVFRGVGPATNRLKFGVVHQVVEGLHHSLRRHDLWTLSLQLQPLFSTYRQVLKTEANSCSFSYPKLLTTGSLFWQPSFATSCMRLSLRGRKPGTGGSAIHERWATVASHPANPYRTVLWRLAGEGGTLLVTSAQSPWVD